MVEDFDMFAQQQKLKKYEQGLAISIVQGQEEEEETKEDQAYNPDERQSRQTLYSKKSIRQLKDEGTENTSMMVFLSSDTDPGMRSDVKDS